VIETRGLRKSFTSRQRREKKTVEAVRGVDLNVAEGEIFGFLGPNGAGKTTTLRILATLIEPDGGDATVAGVDLRRDPGEVRRRIGYVAQGGSTWDDSTAREELVLQARLYGASKATATERAARVLESFQLSEYADRKCKTYSGGQRRRVDIALGIIHEPKVVFLDEPTTGLDPQSRAHMWDEVRRLRAEGMTVFITTHYLDEADALCDRISIMDHGEIVASGTPADLKRSISGDVVLLSVTAASSGSAASPAVAAAAQALDAAPFVNKLETHDDSVRLYVDDGATAIPQILRALDAASVETGSIELHRPSLDDVFLTKTGRSLRES
jgi:ABC-2 type transport system ATP-binding protein